VAAAARLVRRWLEVHAKLVENVGGIRQHIDEMRHRCTGVAADVAHAGLQQRLGDGEDALAMECLAAPRRRFFTSS